MEYHRVGTHTTTPVTTSTKSSKALPNTLADRCAVSSYYIHHEINPPDSSFEKKKALLLLFLGMCHLLLQFSKIHIYWGRSSVEFAMGLYFWCYELEIVILKLWTLKLVTFELRGSLGISSKDTSYN